MQDKKIMMDNNDARNLGIVVYLQHKVKKKKVNDGSGNKKKLKDGCQ